MGVSGALQWWQEWQLRILVLGSLAIQCVLLVASVARKFPIRSWFRPFIWLAYLGGDAIAIYALATLFNRHRKLQQEDVDGGSISILEVLWAPILLIHLGGQDGITAYNIEDNELWTRHILTALSQVIVTVYVFWKSWSGNDTRLLVAAILLFILGTLKCLEKPWALKRASINSLVSSGKPIRRSINTQKLKIDPLEDFIDKATSPAEEIGYLLTAATPVDFTPYKLFVDLASPSADDRIRMLLSFSALNGDHVYCQLQHWLSQTFQLLYTKQTMFPFHTSDYTGAIVHDLKRKRARARTQSLGYTNITEMESSTNIPALPSLFGFVVRGLSGYITFGAIALFHKSRRHAYSEDDVKVTYALLCCTAAVECFALSANGITRVTETPEPTAVRPENGDMVSQYNLVETRIGSREHFNKRRIKPIFYDMVSQYNLIGLLVRNRKHSWIMMMVGVFWCTDFLQQRWHMKSCSSSLSITKLVFKYLKGGWEHDIRDVSSYKKFNDNRGQFTLQHQGCYQQLEWSLDGAFDESVLLWHLATDFCYYDKGASHSQQCTQDSCPHAWCQKSVHHQGAARCREMSNYMMYLLFVNPEMLMAGTRRDLFTDAYKELNEIIIQGDNPAVKERELTQMITEAVDGGGSLPPDGTQHQQEGIIYDARSIAKVLCGLPQEKMWAVIEGVWVEMLCFSAARCRGYLHAKGLAKGVEYLTYVWLLQYYMGMETLAAKLQRADHHHNGGQHEDDPSSSRVNREATGQEQAAGPSRSSGGAIDEEHVAGLSTGYQGSDARGEEIG